MQRYAIVDGSGTVINIIDYAAAPTAEEMVPFPNCTAAQIDAAEPGGTYVNGTYTPPTRPASPKPLVPSISHRQFYQQLMAQGLITEAEAMGVISGTLPAALQTLVGQLPAAEQFPAKWALLSAGQLDRNNSLTETIGTAYGWTDAQIDAFFTAAALL
jgi:hypothetical protein